MLQPAPVTTQPPQASASTNSAIRAMQLMCSVIRTKVDIRQAQAAHDFFGEWFHGEEISKPSRTIIARTKHRQPSIVDLLRQNSARRLKANPNSKRISVATLDEVGEQQHVLNTCRGSIDKNCVYVIAQRDGHGYVKIGTTVDLLSRVGSHQSNAYGELTLIAAFHGDEDDERKLHARFRRDRVWGHREHFYPSSRVLRWIEDVVRLNGRDNDMCWACRLNKTKIDRNRPWTGDAIIPEEITLDIERVDLRCDRRSQKGRSLCVSRHVWFDRVSRRIATGWSSWGGASKVPCSTAYAVLESTDDRALAVALWMSFKYSKASRCSGVLASAINSNQAMLSPEFRRRIDDHRPDVSQNSTNMFPDGETFPECCERQISPWTPQRDNTKEYREFVSAMKWLAALFRKYGTAAICACDYEKMWSLDLEIDGSAVRVGSETVIPCR